MIVKDPRFACHCRELRRFQRYAATAGEHGAVGLRACQPVIDAVAVAAVETGLRAEPPNCVLHKPGKIGRKCRIELARIDLPSDSLDNGGTAIRRIAAAAIGMLG